MTGKPDTATHRVLKGGSYFFPAICCECAFWTFLPEDEHSQGLGLRVVLTVGEQAESRHRHTPGEEVDRTPNKPDGR